LCLKTLRPIERPLKTVFVSKVSSEVSLIEPKKIIALKESWKTLRHKHPGLQKQLQVLPETLKEGVCSVELWRAEQVK